MWLIVFLLHRRLFEGVLDVEGGGIEPPPVPRLLRHTAIVRVHVGLAVGLRLHREVSVLNVGLDGQGLGVELGLAAGSDLLVDELCGFGNIERGLDTQGVLVEGPRTDLRYMCTAVDLLVCV